MQKKKRWEIAGLKKNKPLLSSAKVILSERIKVLEIVTAVYFDNQSVENLHKLRIALRRLRYSIELFISCFDRKVILRFYNKLVKLQDISGMVRDFDVMLENIKIYTRKEPDAAKLSLTEIIIKSRKSQKEVLSAKITKFRKSKVYSDFVKQL